MPIQQNTPMISIAKNPVSINPKSESNTCILKDCNSDLNDKQNPIVFNATKIVLASANNIPIDAPNSGPIDLEIMKYKPPKNFQYYCISEFTLK